MKYGGKVETMINYEIRDIGKHDNCYGIYYKGEIMGYHSLYTAKIKLLEILCKNESAEIIEYYVLKLDVIMFDDAMSVLDKCNRLDVKKRFIYI